MAADKDLQFRVQIQRLGTLSYFNFPDGYFK